MPKELAALLQLVACTASLNCHLGLCMVTLLLSLGLAPSLLVMDLSIYTPAALDGAQYFYPFQLCLMLQSGVEK